MHVEAFCTRHVATASAGTAIAEAARMMRTDHVGDLVVVEQTGAVTRPVGIVTDRDLVVEVLAAGVDPSSLTLGDLRSRELVLAHEQDDLVATLQRMSTHGVRRVPVVDASGALRGILAADDVISLVGTLAGALVTLVEQQRLDEASRRP